ncbi:hypothetical protein BO70DRAFT_358771 [Aspergillus heteromorphus CBS 117.55]|uniref:Uncharacterized protein n=1 Tax=Aspergillus heteromorphus CBS 117.55 TaxID=1448321 RepID=A0A317WVA5_9EURO|nr:uncharacterized protein BO70DRAFT_358771 [Aspergillus heteromorphus CBS 117.55]PWY89751.1 hypothetical protein BO70DRAFT_358771 [Aspergillus heteromorphus CBS 117.55]
MAILTLGGLVIQIHSQAHIMYRVSKELCLVNRVDITRILLQGLNLDLLQVDPRSQRQSSTVQPSYYCLTRVNPGSPDHRQQ